MPHAPSLFARPGTSRLARPAFATPAGLISAAALATLTLAGQPGPNSAPSAAGSKGAPTPPAASAPSTPSTPGRSAVTAPEPSPIRKSWELNVTWGELRCVIIETDEGRRPFLFLTYKVVNNSGQDVLFAPAFELSTDQGSPIRAGRDVPPGVARAILDKIGNPLIKDQISVIGNLLQGEENAREGLVVWPINQSNPGRLVVYASGFSGETANVSPPVPVPVEKSPDPVTGKVAQATTPATGAANATVAASTTEDRTEIILRKTARLTYSAVGELQGRNGQPIPRTEFRWIMR